MRYRAVCDNCELETYSSIRKDTAEKFAEEHMMKTGHTVQVEEV